MSGKFHRKKYLLHIPGFKILSDELPILYKWFNLTILSIITKPL